jgi:hypothetical protein
MSLPNFEVVANASDGVQRFSRYNLGLGLGPNSLAEIEAAPWNGPLDGFASDSLTHVSLINSTFGNLEVVIVTPDGSLEHYYRTPDGIWRWGATISVPAAWGRASGPPSLIQRLTPQPGAQHADFELLVPSDGGVVLHFTRHNDNPNFVWTPDSSSGFGIDVLGVALIESDYGNLECIVTFQRDAELWHFYHDPVSQTWEKSTSLPITSGSGAGLADGRLTHPGAYGSPGMAQLDYRHPNDGSGASHQNFEVVVPTPGNTLAHYYRDNSAGGQTWFATEEFGFGDYVTLIKSLDFKSLEVIASGAPGLTHFRRDSIGGGWSQTATFAGGSTGGAAGFIEDPWFAYNNTTQPPLGANTQIPGSSVPTEIGAQITLAGDGHFIRQLTFFYFSNFPDVTTATLRFYQYGGPGMPPGTLLYESDPISLNTVGSGAQTIEVDHLVPDATFIWTLTSNGPAFVGNAANSFFLWGSYPPTIGSCAPFCWQRQLFVGDLNWFKWEDPSFPLSPDAAITATMS